MAAEHVLDGRLAWVADTDPIAKTVLAARRPGIPNHGDITTADWTTVESIDVITAGFPCQDISTAGRRAGITEGTRSGIWRHVAHAVRVLQPALLFVENVAAIRSQGLDTVLADLAALRYDTRWACVRASESELRTPETGSSSSPGPHASTPPAKQARLLRTPQAFDASFSAGRCPVTRIPTGRQVNLADQVRCCGRTKPSEVAPAVAPCPASKTRPPGRVADWGVYRKAIRDWEQISGRAAPAATTTDNRGRSALNPRFVEWMMGLETGFITDLELSARAQLHVLGNGVVPQQAAHALTCLLHKRALSRPTPDTTRKGTPVDHRQSLTVPPIARPAV